MRCSIVLFDGFTALDVVGGYEVIANLPGVDVEFVSFEVGTVATDTRRLGLMAYETFANVNETDILYVPGGPGVVPSLQDEELLAHLARLHATATWTYAVCNGVALLGAAGLLAGRVVTTNWGWRDRVRAYGATVVSERYHVDSDLVTGAGVSASIDAALALAALVASDDIARVIRLGIEYYPQPPGGPADADTEPELFRSLVADFEATTASQRLGSLQPPFATVARRVVAQ